MIAGAKSTKSVVDPVHDVPASEELRRREVRDQSAHDLDDPDLLRARNESCAQLVGHVGGAVNEVIVLGEDVDGRRLAVGERRGSCPRRRDDEADCLHGSLLLARSV